MGGRATQLPPSPPPSTIHRPQALATKADIYLRNPRDRRLYIQARQRMGEGVVGDISPPIIHRPSPCPLLPAPCSATLTSRTGRRRSAPLWSLAKRTCASRREGGAGGRYHGRCHLPSPSLPLPPLPLPSPPLARCPRRPSAHTSRRSRWGLPTSASSRRSAARSCRRGGREGREGGMGERIVAAPADMERRLHPCPSCPRQMHDFKRAVAYYAQVRPPPPIPPPVEGPCATLSRPHTRRPSRRRRRGAHSQTQCHRRSARPCAPS